MTNNYYGAKCFFKNIFYLKIIIFKYILFLILILQNYKKIIKNINLIPFQSKYIFKIYSNII
jgi:hypothetical protein